MKTKKLEEIEQLRREMVKKALILGINHPSVLKISQRIDMLHNELMRIELNEKERKYSNNNDTFKIFEDCFSVKYA